MLGLGVRVYRLPLLPDYGKGEFADRVTDLPSLEACCVVVVVAATANDDDDDDDCGSGRKRCFCANDGGGG